MVGLIVAFPETRYVRNESSTPPQVPSDKAQELPETTTEDEKHNMAAVECDERQVVVSVDEALGHGKPSRKQFALLQDLDRQALKDVWRHLWTPVELFFNPIVCWAAWTMAGAANAFLLLVLFESPIFANAPYNWGTGSIGFANFAPAVGTIVALAVCGPFSDWVALHLAKRNRGIFEPEMRLPALIPFLVISLIALLVSRTDCSAPQKTFKLKNRLSRRC